MESNGVAGRIHVSEAVATELQKGGYSRWLVAREDKVHAKGKGAMQTYWIVGGAHSTGGMSGDESDFEGSTTQALGGVSTDDSLNNQDLNNGDIIMADREVEDNIMLDIEEKLQRRASLRALQNKGQQPPTQQASF